VNRIFSSSCPARAQWTQLSHPGQAFGHRAPEPGHCAFFLGTQIEEALAQLRPKTTAPASWRPTLPWVSPGAGAGAGWWVTHDISTDCFGGRSFYDLGGMFTYQTARKAPAIHWGSPIGSHKNIFSVLVDHFRAPEHPCEWWLQRSSRRRW
jgi:hypothetical protein